MREFIIYLIPVVIGAIALRFFGKKRQEKQTGLLNTTAQKAGWTEASDQSTVLLQTLHDFRLFRRGTRTKVLGTFIINDKDRLFFLEHGSMTNNVTYNYIVLFCTIKNQHPPQFNISLKQHNRARSIPENHTRLQSEPLGSLGGRYDVESQTPDTSHLLNLLTPHAISMFEAMQVGDKHPEMEVKGQHLLIYRPKTSGESSETIEKFVQLAQKFSKNARLI